MVLFDQDIVRVWTAHSPDSCLMNLWTSSGKKWSVIFYVCMCVIYILVCVCVLKCKSTKDLHLLLNIIYRLCSDTEITLINYRLINSRQFTQGLKPFKRQVKGHSYNKTKNTMLEIEKGTSKHQDTPFIH